MESPKRAKAAWRRRGVHKGLRFGQCRLPMTPTSVRAIDVEAAVRRLAEQQHGLVGRRQLRTIGIDARRLKPLLARGALLPVTEEVLAVSGAPDTKLRQIMAAVLDAPPGAIASHETAAGLWNVPGFPLEGPTHVTVPHQGTTKRSRLAIIHFHRDMPLDEVVLRAGIPVATPTLAAFQLCGAVHPGRATRAFDAMTVRRLTSGRRLRSLVDRIGASGRNGTRLARELAKRNRDTSPPESGLESRVEWLGSRAGLKLERQVEVGGEHLVGRADFRVAGTTGLIEAQSLLYHSSPLDAAADKRRIDRLLEAGFSVLTVWDYQAFHYPDLVIETLAGFVRKLAGRPDPFHLDCPSP